MSGCGLLLLLAGCSEGSYVGSDLKGVSSGSSRVHASKGTVS